MHTGWGAEICLTRRSHLIKILGARNLTETMYVQSTDRYYSVTTQNLIARKTLLPGFVTLLHSLYVWLQFFRFHQRLGGQDVAPRSLVGGSEGLGDILYLHVQGRSADGYTRVQTYSEALCLESRQAERVSCLLSSVHTRKQAFVYLSRYFFLYSFICLFFPPFFRIILAIFRFESPYIFFCYFLLFFLSFMYVFYFHNFVPFILLVVLLLPFSSTVYCLVYCPVSASRIHTVLLSQWISVCVTGPQITTYV